MLLQGGKPDARPSGGHTWLVGHRLLAPSLKVKIKWRAVTKGFFLLVMAAPVFKTHKLATLTHQDFVPTHPVVSVVHEGSIAALLVLALAPETKFYSYHIVTLP